MKIKYLPFVFMIIFTFAAQAIAAQVDRVEITGNKRIPEDRIRPYLVKTGSEFSPDAISKSIAQLHSTGYFLEVMTDASVVNNQFTVTYILKETPLIAGIQINGSKEYSNEKLMDTIALKQGVPLNLTQIGVSIKSLQAAYEQDDFFNAQISHKLEYLNETSVNVIFDVIENEPSRVYNIWFSGNENYTAAQLKEQMMTKEKDFWSGMNSSGMLMRDLIDVDRERLRQFYLSEGYATVEVSEAQIDNQQQKQERMNYLVRIKEGARFTVSSVQYGDTLRLFTEEQFKEHAKLRVGDYFNVSTFRQDVLSITDMYTEIGYAHANVQPQVNLDPDTNTVSISYTVDEGALVYINRIEFTGNEKTRDNVLRREFDIHEGDLYNSKLLREAERNLRVTGFYDDVRVAERSVDSTHSDIIADVKEARDGSISFTASYSTANSWMGRVEFAQANFFGYGTTVKLSAQVTSDGDQKDYMLSYFDPWLLNRPYSLGLDLYSRETGYDEYTKATEGVSVRLGHQPIKRRLFMSYTLAYDYIDIYDIARNASSYIKDQEGVSETVSITPAITYSHLNNNIDPSNGIKATARAKYATSELGGDNDYVKGLLETSYYYPLGRKFVTTLHAEGGQMWKTTDQELPIDERFYLGGMYTVRGFRTREISPKDEHGYSYGGDKYYQANLEIWRPIFDGGISIRLVGFVDIGQVFDDEENFGSRPPRKTAGGGIRMFTPIGLLRFEMGYKLDRKEGEEKSRLEFSIGSKF